jgi:hypothetical protein
MPFTIDTRGKGRPAPRPMTENTPGRYGARPYTARETWGALLFLALFGLPFAVAGVWALSGVPGKWAHGDPRDALVLTAAGLAFALVGFGLMAGAAVGRGKIGAEAKAAWEHPDEPWKWRSDWAAGHVLDGGKNDTLGMITFAVLWNLVALPAGWLGWEEGVKHGVALASIALLFPAVGVGLAVWAARGVIRVKRFGVSRLDLASVPVPVGRTLAGTIRTRLTTTPEGGFTLTLSALRITRSGPDNDRSTRVLWQEEAQTPGQLSGGTDGVRVVAPVAIRIPPEAPSTDHSAIDDEVVWRLEVRAAEPGVDYTATFELPIYRTADSDQPDSAQDAPHLRAVGPIPPGRMTLRNEMFPPSFAVPDAASLGEAPRPEPRSAIEVTNQAGALVIDFPAARNPSMAFGLTAFTAIFTAATVFMIRMHAPFFFPIVFGLFDILMAWITLTLWFEVTRLRVNSAGVKVASGLGAPGAEKLYPAAQIKDVRVAIGMTANTTTYYDLKLVRPGGQEITVGGGIRHKREAEWLAAQILTALGQARRA